MAAKRLAHLSDLHIGFSPRTDRAAQAVCDHLLTSGVDHVVVTGDVTHGGRLAEMRRFSAIFHPLLMRGKMTVIPGNHDCLREEAGRSLMSSRAEAETLEGLYLVKVDSTGPHNRSFLAGHGALDEGLIDRVGALLGQAPRNALCAILIHHHLLPLPVETFVEWFAHAMRWPFANELSLGLQLLRRMVGACDLVLHGHRHIPRHARFAVGPRPLSLFNAGSTTELLAYRVFTHEAGRLIAAPSWVHVDHPVRRAWLRRRPQLAAGVPPPLGESGTSEHPVPLQLT